MKTPLTLDAAQAVAADLCAARNVALVYPGSALRDVLVYGLATLHKLGLGGWDLDAARERVTLTMPAVGTALAGLVASLPVVGGMLAAVAEQQAQTTIYLSPVACADPVTLLDVVAHELGHADQIAVGGLPWCFAYAVVPEVRAGAEAPCYTQDIAVEHACRGGDPKALCDGAFERLKSYGLDDASLALARGVLDVAQRTLEHGGEFGGPSHDVLEALRERGVL